MTALPDDHPPPSPDSAAFDGFAESYCDILDSDLKLAGEDSDFFAQVKIERMLSLCNRHLAPSRELSFLDVGCGTGIAEQHLHARAKRVVGADVSHRMVDVARQRCPDGEFVHYSPGRLPFDDAAFDVAFCFCVLHHVPPAERAIFMDEMKRVVRPGGLLFSFEHNPLNPVTRHIVRNCPFDHDAILLWQGEMKRLCEAAGVPVIDSGFYLFFPGFLKFLRPLEAGLRWLPLGGQYYVAARKPEAGTG